MREEKWKKAVQEISKNAGYATIAIACEKALEKDTAEGYREALQVALEHPMYLSTELIAKKALRDE